jgi:hypothetical protein
MLETPSILCYAYSVTKQQVRTISRKVKLTIVFLAITILVILFIAVIWPQYCGKNANRSPKYVCYMQQTNCPDSEQLWKEGYSIECYASLPIYKEWLQKLQR